MTGFKRIKSIDGLRGFSILLVLLCHLDVPWFRGGFVGVDVFFVISGFVITGSLYDHLSEPGLIAGFYERRVRRLLPSLLVVLLVTYGCFSSINEPFEQQRLARTTALASLGLSNFFFSRTGGYFDDALLENPLLHTWSLAVEEQFYVLFAVLLVVMRMAAFRNDAKIAQRLLVFMSAGSLLSLALAIFLTHANAHFSYFMLPARFWEIGFGSVLLLVGRRYPLPFHPTLSLTGFVLIVASAVLFDSSTPYPGYNALFPAVGSILIISGSNRQGGFVDELFSSRLMVFLGQISYALYLVHWPLIVFAEDYFVRDMTIVEKVGVASASIVLASVLTFLWEIPFQERRFLPTRRGLWACSVGGAFAACAIGISAEIHPVAEPSHEQVPPANVSLSDFQNIAPKGGPNDPIFIETSRIPVVGFNPSNVTAVWGDSHALSLLFDLVSRSKQDDASYRFFVCFGTMPILNLNSYSAEERHQEEVADILVSDSRIKNVVLIANWTGYLEGMRFFGHRMGFTPVFDFHGAHVTRRNAYDIFESEFRLTLKKLTATGKDVFICTPFPTYPFDVSKGVKEIQRRDRDPNHELSYSFDQYLNVNRRLLAVFDKLSAENPHVVIVPIHLAFFQDGRSLVEKKARVFTRMAIISQTLARIRLAIASPRRSGPTIASAVATAS